MQNKKIISLTVLILTLNSFTIAHSQSASVVTSHEGPSVDLHDGSLQIETRDFSFIRRTYNSRLNYFGYFGFGWCSDLEWQIRENQGRVEIQHCGESFIAEIKKGTRAETVSSLTSIMGSSRLILRKQNRHWLLTLQPNIRNGIRRKIEIDFDSFGRPFRISIPDTPPLTLKWGSRNTLESIKVGLLINLKVLRSFGEETVTSMILCTSGSKTESCPRQKIYNYDSNKLVRAEESQTNSVASLQTSFSSPTSVESFQYDFEDNLISFMTSENQKVHPIGKFSGRHSSAKTFFAKIDYNSEMDLVSAVTTSEGCRSQYQYHRTQDRDQVIVVNEVFQTYRESRTTEGPLDSQTERRGKYQNTFDFVPSLGSQGAYHLRLSLRSVYRELEDGKLSFLSESTTQTRSKVNEISEKPFHKNLTLRADVVQPED